MIGSGVKVIDKESIKHSEIDVSGRVNGLLSSLFGNDASVMNNFVKCSFQHHPVVIRGSETRINGIINDYLFNLEVADMLENTASDDIQVWLGKSNSNEPTKPLESIKVPTAEQAYKLFKAGHSLYCRASSEMESTCIHNLLASLGYGCNTTYCMNDKYSRGEIETFYTNIGHVTENHTDFQENFTIHLKGYKKWSFKKSSLVHPIRGCTPHFDANGLEDVVEQQVKVCKLINPDFRGNEFKNSSVNNNANVTTAKEEKGANTGNNGNSKKRAREVTSSASSSSTASTSSKDNEQEELYSVIVGPGDVLYHPAGVWHRVECIANPYTNQVDSIKQGNGKKTKLASAAKDPKEDTYSLAINLSLIASSYAEVFTNALQQLLWKTPAFRQPVRGISSTHPLSPLVTPPHVVMRELLQHLPDLLKTLTAADILPKPVLYDSALVVNRSIDVEHDNDDDDDDECSDDDVDDDDDDDNEEEENDQGDEESNGDNSQSESESEDESEYQNRNSLFYQILVINDDFPCPSNITMTTAFKVNPCAMIINVNTECHDCYNGYYSRYANQEVCIDTDTFVLRREDNQPSYYEYIRQGASPEAYYIYAIHCTYGNNEGLESLCKRTIAIPKAIAVNLMDLWVPAKGNLSICGSQCVAGLGKKITNA